MLQRNIVISNKLGLHARASAKFVSAAGHYGCAIEVAKDEHKVNGKSIMGVMALAASKGTELTLTTDGDDEERAMNDLLALINDKFGEAE